MAHKTSIYGHGRAAGAAQESCFRRARNRAGYGHAVVDFLSRFFTMKSCLFFFERDTHKRLFLNEAHTIFFDLHLGLVFIDCVVFSLGASVLGTKN